MDEPEQSLLFPDLQTGDLHYCTVDKNRESSGLEHIEDQFYESTFQERINAVIARIDELGLPRSGQQYRLITMRTFSAVEFIEHIASRKIITEAILVVYSLSRMSAFRIARQVKRRHIHRLLVLVSNLRNTAAVEKEDATVNILMQTPNVEVFFENSHAKIFSCLTDSGESYTLEGSGNLACNSRIEQYTLDTDPALYHFHRKWMENLKSKDNHGTGYENRMV